MTNVQGTKSSVSARIILDTGADNAFITTDMAQRIGAIQKGSEILAMAGFQEAKRKSKKYPIFEFDLALTDGRKMTISAYGTDSITCPFTKHVLDTAKNPLLTRIPLAEPLCDHPEQVSIDVLIGSDYYYDIVNAERISLQDGLYLFDSKLGYVVGGRTSTDSKDVSQLLLSREFCAAQPEIVNLERLWKLDEIGIRDPPDTNEDEVALKGFNETIRFNEDEKRYEVKWPWKLDAPALPDNFKLSAGRLKSLVTRIKENKPVMEKYQSTIDDQIAKGVIEEAPTTPDGPVVHYIPHHCVITPQKTTTKLRIVYDASSKANRQMPALNDCVYRGPVLLEDLCGLLLRFRVDSIGVVSDIEKAFLQVGLQTEDRDVARFLWLRDPSKPSTKENLIHYRFRRVCFGVISSPFLLAGTLIHHLKKIGTPLAEEISANLYVDNVIGSKHSTEEALRYYKGAKDIFEQASMNLREWYSNDTGLMAGIAEADRGVETTTKVLGLQWDLKTDTLTCQSTKLAFVVLYPLFHMYQCNNKEENGNKGKYCLHHDGFL